MSATAARCAVCGQPSQERATFAVPATGGDRMKRVCLSCWQAHWEGLGGNSADLTTAICDALQAVTERLEDDPDRTLLDELAQLLAEDDPSNELCWLDESDTRENRDQARDALLRLEADTRLLLAWIAARDRMEDALDATAGHIIATVTDPN